MIFWIFFVLIAVFLWSLVNISDQYLVAKFTTGEQSSAGLVLFGSFLGIFIALAIGLYTRGIFLISTPDKLLLLVVGGITIAWVILYLFALEIGDVSAVVPWFLTIPVFGYILGYIFLGETISLQQLIGSAIILAGGFFIVADFSGQRKKSSYKPALYMVCASFLIAAAGTMFKYVTIGGNFWVSSFWEYVGFGFFGIIVYLLVPKYRREFMSMLKRGGKKIFAVNMMIETLTITGNMLNNFALLLAPLGMVYLMQAFQPAIVLCMALIGTKFFPTIIKEDTSKRVLIPKIIAITIMIIGSVMLFM